MVLISGHGHLRLADQLSYIKINSLMWVKKYDIAGTPLGVPYPHVWNGSIWTLAWEGLCYVGIAAIGIVGLLRHRWVPVILFALAWLVALTAATGVVDRWLIVALGRFAPMFLAGVVVQVWADRIHVNRSLIIGSIVALLASTFLPDYRLLAAFPITYLLIVAGSFIRSPHLQFHNDISYGLYVYAFPVQQSLALFGAWRLGVPAFALVAAAATVPFAAGSWFGVERWALKLKTRRRPVNRTAQPNIRSVELRTDSSPAADAHRPTAHD